MEICAVHAVGELGLEGKVQVGDEFRRFRGSREWGKVYGGERHERSLKKKRMGTENVGIRRGK